MRRVVGSTLLLLLSLSACSPATPAPHEVLGPALDGTLPAHLDFAQPAALPPDVDSAVIGGDLDVLVDGNVSPDALGALFDRVIARAHSHAGDYLDLFERRFVSSELDDESLASLHLVEPLDILQSDAPARVGALAARLRARLDAAITRYRGAGSRWPAIERTAADRDRFFARLAMRRLELDVLDR